MEYDIPPGVALSPPREPGAVMMSPATWSMGVEGRPQRLSRFDTPPHGIEVAPRHAPPTKIGAPQDAPLRMPSDFPLVECLSHSFVMTCNPEVSGVAADTWTMADWDTPVSASRSVFIPSGLRNAAPFLESSQIVQEL